MHLYPNPPTRSDGPRLVAQTVGRLPPTSFFLTSAVFHYLALHWLSCCSSTSMPWVWPGPRIASAAMLFALWRRPWCVLAGARGRQRCVLIGLGAQRVPLASRAEAVQRQYTGTAGRIENVQVAVYLTYTAPRGHALIDRALYVPKIWSEDAGPRERAGIPAETRFATKPALALQMIISALDTGLSASFGAGDEVCCNGYSVGGTGCRLRFGGVAGSSGSHPARAGPRGQPGRGVRREPLQVDSAGATT